MAGEDRSLRERDLGFIETSGLSLASPRPLDTSLARRRARYRAIEWSACADAGSEAPLVVLAGGALDKCRPRHVTLDKEAAFVWAADRAVRMAPLVGPRRSNA